MVYILLENKSVTAKELARRFEVSKRTVLRDVETLAQAGVPVYTTRGKGGGISILEGFVLNKAALSPEEQNQILFALESLAPAQPANGESLLAKLTALFGKADAPWIEVDFSRWGNTVPDWERFGVLKDAVLQAQALAFAYPNAYGEIVEREVYPLKLVFKARAWYLQAYCLHREAYRTFKINRMLHLRLLPGRFSQAAYAPPPIDPPGVASAALVRLVLWCAPHAAQRVYDEFDSTAVQKNSDGSFTVAVDLPEDGWLYGFLLSFGTAARVLEPPEVRARLLQQMEALKDFYSGI